MNAPRVAVWQWSVAATLLLIICTGIVLYSRATPYSASDYLADIRTLPAETGFARVRLVRTRRPKTPLLGAASNESVVLQLIGRFDVGRSYDIRLKDLSEDADKVIGTLNAQQTTAEGELRLVLHADRIAAGDYTLAVTSNRGDAQVFTFRKD